MHHDSDQKLRKVAPEQGTEDREGISDKESGTEVGISVGLGGKTGTLGVR